MPTEIAASLPISRRHFSTVLHCIQLSKLHCMYHLTSAFSHRLFVAIAVFFQRLTVSKVRWFDALSLNNPCSSVYSTAPMAHSIRLWLEIQRYWVRIPTGSDVYYRGCSYTVLQTVQMPWVCSVVYSTVHCKEPFKLFDKSWAYSRLQASFCHKIAMIVQNATLSNIHLYSIVSTLYVCYKSFVFVFI